MSRFPPVLLALASCATSLTPQESADRDYRLALGTHDDRRAIEFLDRAIECFPLAGYYMTRGMLHQSLEEPQAALDDYAAALRAGPNGALDPAQSARLHLNRGVLYVDARRWREAEEDFSEAIRLTPGYTEAYLERASVRRKLERPAEAEADLVLARRVGVGKADGFYNEGVRSVTQGAIADAERMFRFALDLDPSHPLAHIGMARLDMQRRRFAEAVLELDQAISSRPRDAELYYHRGTSHLEAGDPEKALADFTKAVELAALPPYLAARGLAFHRVRHDEPKARADLEEALRIDPECYLAWLDRGVLHFELGELGPAEADLRRALGIRATAEATLALGHVFHDRKKFDQALDLYRLALELYKDPDVRKMLEEESERTRRDKEEASK